MLKDISSSLAKKSIAERFIFLIQAAFEGLQIAAHSEVPQNSVSSDMQFDYQVAVNGQSHQREYLDGVRIPSSAGEAEVLSHQPLLIILQHVVSWS